MKKFKRYEDANESILSNKDLKIERVEKKIIVENEIFKTSESEEDNNEKRSSHNS